MPTKERRLREKSKKDASGGKPEEKRVPQGGIELINEHQQTIFDTQLSSAADDYVKSSKEHKLWGEKEKACAKNLIEEMKRMKLNVLRVGTEKIIKYKFVDSKEVVTLKDYKPAKVRRRRNF